MRKPQQGKSPPKRDFSTRLDEAEANFIVAYAEAWGATWSRAIAKMVKRGIAATEAEIKEKT